MKKSALFAFNGDAMCFIHVLLNALDLSERGHEVRVVIEGAATRLIPDLEDESSPLFKLYTRAREQGLIHGACRACASKMGTASSAEEQGLALLDDMSGHPSMARFMEEDYDIVTF
ncbi:MAG: cytoplasmic protein [Desulfobacteraceae bacterium]|jgi:hypothetical protein